MSLVILVLARKIGKFGILAYWKTTGRPTVPAKPKACYFTGAGVYFFWQIGAAKYMQETCSLKGMDIVGASAGSLTGLLLLSGVDFDKATNVALTQTLESGVYTKPSGLAGELGGLLFAWLDTVLPAELPDSVLRNLHVALAPAAAKPPKTIAGFSDRAEVISACMTSCHIPVFSDGRPTTEFRGESCVDGSFWYFVTKNRFTGLPLPKDISPDEVFWVDYTDDDEFLSSIDGNFLKIQTQDGILDMVEAGYNHMKREHYYGRLPMARFQRPTWVVSSVLRGLGANVTDVAVSSREELASAAAAAAQGVANSLMASASAVVSAATASATASVSLPSTSSFATAALSTYNKVWNIRVPDSGLSWTSLMSLSSVTATSGSTAVVSPDDSFSTTNNTTTAQQLWRNRLPTFAESSVKWFLAAKDVDGLGSALINLFVISLAWTQRSRLV